MDFIPIIRYNMIRKVSISKVCNVSQEVKRNISQRRMTKSTHCLARSSLEVTYFEGKLIEHARSCLSSVKVIVVSF
jgi:hypothetical protein